MDPGLGGRSWSSGTQECVTTALGPVGLGESEEHVEASDTWLPARPDSALCPDGYLGWLKLSQASQTLLLHPKEPLRALPIPEGSWDVLVTGLALGVELEERGE